MSAGQYGMMLRFIQRTRAFFLQSNRIDEIRYHNASQRWMMPTPCQRH